MTFHNPNFRLTQPVQRIHGCINRLIYAINRLADFVATVDALARETERIVVVGGTPFYLKALLRPLAPLPGDREAPVVDVDVQIAAAHPRHFGRDDVLVGGLEDVDGRRVTVTDCYPLAARRHG